MMDDPVLEAKSDRELLLLTAQRLGFVEEGQGRLEEGQGRLVEKVGIQNGRVSKVEGFAETLEKVKLPTRMEAMERWQARFILVVGFWSVAWPFLIQEFRQFVLERFGFI